MALSTLLLVAALPIAGCSSSGPKSPNAAAGERPTAFPTPSSSVSLPGKEARPTAVQPPEAVPMPEQTPHWYGPALPGPKAETVAERLKQQWGLEFHVQQIRAVGAGLPGHVAYEALKQFPEGYSLIVMIQADGDGRPRNIVLTANGAPSAAMAATMAQGLDLSLDGHASDERKSWVQHQFAEYERSAQVSSTVPRRTDGEVTTSLSVVPDRTTLQLSGSLPS